MKIKIEDIIVPKGRRPLDQAKVAEIAASIKAVGLLEPIGIRGWMSPTDGSLSNVNELAYGRHRLEACRSLGWTEIEAVTTSKVCPEDVYLDDATVEMMEIAENLHRVELTPAQRNEYLARWVALLKKRNPSDIGNRSPISKPGRKPSAAVAEVAKATGIGVKTVKEAVAASKVSPAVKAAADKAELTAKQRLAISRIATEAEQLAAVEATYNRHFAEPDTRAPTDAGKYDDVAEHRATFDQFKVFLKVFDALEARSDADQVAEAVLLLAVGDHVPRLLRISTFATQLVKIINSEMKSRIGAATGAAP